LYGHVPAAAREALPFAAIPARRAFPIIDPLMQTPSQAICSNSAMLLRERRKLLNLLLVRRRAVVACQSLELLPRSAALVKFSQRNPFFRGGESPVLRGINAHGSGEWECGRGVGEQQFARSGSLGRNSEAGHR
jgi:hypothetical protein